MKYKFEKSVPLPARARGGSLRSVMRELREAPAGTSIFIPASDYAIDSIRGATQMVGPGWAAKSLFLVGGEGIEPPTLSV